MKKSFDKNIVITKAEIERDNAEKMQGKLRQLRIKFIEETEPYRNRLAEQLIRCPARSIVIRKNSLGYPIGPAPECKLRREDIVKAIPSDMERLTIENYTEFCEVVFKRIANSLGLPADVFNNINFDEDKNGEE